ncbi:hypothetical protein C6990_05350 [Nitrosopumilus sp. b3]|uniref:hypothetical protein n=1 Tax=Nitrosopumilus sp. b3 TaxID=2109909 RepID=UPI0015F61F9A|nr:hypothetical protein [Nitrosopumilus sp. b3]KAF6247107.1 hypothetical protein C6990_05350 [Nitrosopumilus sp. b3]
MEKCNPWFTLTNIGITAFTAAVEYKTAPTIEEGIRKIGKRIEENKTIEAIVECAVNDTECDC